VTYSSETKKKADADPEKKPIKVQMKDHLNIFWSVSFSF
jgi:hypothetical protein